MVDATGVDPVLDGSGIKNPKVDRRHELIRPSIPLGVDRAQAWDVASHWQALHDELARRELSSLSAAAPSPRLTEAVTSPARLGCRCSRLLSDAIGVPGDQAAGQRLVCSHEPSRWQTIALTLRIIGALPMTHHVETVAILERV